jgi:signal peptidase I
LAAKKKSFIREWLEAILIALLIVILIRGFAFEAFMVPTSSMENTLLKGDFIIVNKLSYGPRTPITPISFPFAHQHIPVLSAVKGYWDGIQLPYFRLPGFGSVSRNDVVVFNYPVEDDFPTDHKTHYVKRCVALPGDTLFIDRGQVLINRTLLEDPQEIKSNYLIKSTTEEPEFLQKIDLSEGGRFMKANEFLLPLTKSMAEELKIDPEVYELSPKFETAGEFRDYIFPYYKGFRWNADNFGPLIVPREGITLSLSKSNIHFYRKIIEVYEQNSLEETPMGFIINGKETDSYTFKMNYYFFLGDNRHYSSDSRYWGFVPEDHIVGKASFVFFSLKPHESLLNKVRWNRFFNIL